jgi:hypothetical protein
MQKLVKTDDDIRFIAGNYGTTGTTGHGQISRGTYGISPNPVVRVCAFCSRDRSKDEATTCPGCGGSEFKKIEQARMEAPTKETTGKPSKADKEKEYRARRWWLPTINWCQ